MTEIEIQSRSKFNLTSQDASEMHSFYTLEDTVTRSTISNNRSKYNNRELNNSLKLIQSFGIRDRKLVMEYGLNVLHAVGDGSNRTEAHRGRIAEALR